MCTSESEVCATHRDRQQARERDVAEQSQHGRLGMQAEPDEDKLLLAWVYSRYLTTMETDACRLRRKNAKALRLAFEQLERAVSRMKGLIVLSDSDDADEDDDNCISSGDDQLPPRAVHAYRCADNRKGKCPARKW
ncbi:Phosphorylated carbohydrates phosphatase [Hordeum vulgare]|nr:Phosphorylated carbohydrates phosphatase [Hordeum vulgare]KAE8816378.1 Phosphorylated carbohydrates phosphatase [Hordeum vulgare]